MAHMNEMTVGITTVGQLVEALARFPSDMPVSADSFGMIQVYRLAPESDEQFEDPRGEIRIEGDCGLGDID